MPNLISLINQVVNNHTVIAKAKSRNTHTYWVIKCNNCGKTREVQGTHIRNACFSPCSCSAGKEQRICPICNKSYEVNISSTRKFCFDCSLYFNDDAGHIETITAVRRAIKRNFVRHKGGQCQICGYDKCIEDLPLHHKDPKSKDFSISALRQYTEEAMKLYYNEVDKCILTCANCHAEIHAGLIDINAFD